LTNVYNIKMLNKRECSCGVGAFCFAKGLLLRIS